MTEFKGKYYGSIFIHYQPVDREIWNYSNEDVINAVPPHWRDGVTEPRGSGWAGAVRLHSFIKASSSLSLR